MKHPTNGVVHPDKLIRVVPVRYNLAAWIEIVSNVGFSRAVLNRRIRTTAGQSGISGEDLKQLPIPLCPDLESTRVAAEVDRRLSAILTTGNIFQTNLSRAATMRKSILSKAFSGKLVSQGPNDEPASALLERIRAERVRAQEVKDKTSKGSNGVSSGERRMRVEKSAQPARAGKG